MARRLVLVLLAASLWAVGGAASAADATLVAQGMVSFTAKADGVTRTCSLPSVVEFTNSGSTFILTEATAAGQSPGTPPVCAPVAVGSYFTSTTIRQCTPNGGVVIPGSTLTVSGSTYTVKSPYTSCGGKNGTDTIVLTVSAGIVVYKHDLNDGDGNEIHVSGTLSRVV